MPFFIKQFVSCCGTEWQQFWVLHLRQPRLTFNPFVMRLRFRTSRQVVSLVNVELSMPSTCTLIHQLLAKYALHTTVALCLYYICH